MNDPSGGGDYPTSLAEINVTPLVDVMLVLLIVFMISAPLMQHGVTVDLPKAKTGALSEAPDQIILVVKRDGQLTMNNETVKAGTLLKKLSAIALVKPDIQVFVQGDRKVPYGTIAAVIATAKQAKIQRVGLVTQPSDRKKNL